MRHLKFIPADQWTNGPGSKLQSPASQQHQTTPLSPQLERALGIIRNWNHANDLEYHPTTGDQVEIPWATGCCGLSYRSPYKRSIMQCKKCSARPNYRGSMIQLPSSAPSSWRPGLHKWFQCHKLINRESATCAPSMQNKTKYCQWQKIYTPHYFVLCFISFYEKFKSFSLKNSQCFASTNFFGNVVTFLCSSILESWLAPSCLSPGRWSSLLFLRALR